MKVKDQFKFNAAENTVEHHKTYDAQPGLDRVKAIRDQGFDRKHANGLSESYMVGSLDGFQITEILKKAGLSWDDPAAGDAVLRALQSREYSKYRVWGGNLGIKDRKIIV